jgi:hypothetical protein
MTLIESNCASYPQGAASGDESERGSLTVDVFDSTVRAKELQDLYLKLPLGWYKVRSPFPHSPACDCMLPRMPADTREWHRRKRRSLWVTSMWASLRAPPRRRRWENAFCLKPSTSSIGIVSLSPLWRYLRITRMPLTAHVACLVSAYQLPQRDRGLFGNHIGAGHQRAPFLRSSADAQLQIHLRHQVRERAC